MFNHNLSINATRERMALPQNFDDLLETLNFFDDWEERYRYLIDLGRELPTLDSQSYTEENKVRGCMSQVWLTAEKTTATPPQFLFYADSDAVIVKGLIAVILILYSNKNATEIQAIDITEKFQQLNLEEHLSPNRRNGFFSMVERIQSIARGA
jgi:cysteine desulfuration protein SufE